MDSPRAQLNGISGKETPKYASEEEHADSPLLYKHEAVKNGLSHSFPAIDASNVDLSGKSGNDTRSAKINNNLTIAYYKDDNEDDEDRASASEGVKFLGLSDDDSICSSKTPSEQTPHIPDGGWGWVVVVASFFIATVADGLAFSYGLINARLVKYFESGEAVTSIIGSLFISVPLIAGPLMSALVDRYGCRKMTIVGSIVSTIGFIGAAYSPSISALCVTYGLIAGLGMGLLYVTCVVSIAYWFEKRRNLAVGLGSCGVGFGTFVYSPLTTYLLDEYDWRGCLVLLAGTVLNVCVCGAVMRDPEWLIQEQKKQRQMSKSKRVPSSVSISARSAKSAKSGGADSNFPGTEELKSLMKSGATPEYILTTLIKSITAAENLDAVTKMNADLAQQKVSSVINLPTFLQQSEKVPREVLEQLSTNADLYNIVLENYPSLLALRCNSEQKIPIEPVTEVSKNKPSKMTMKLKLGKKNKKEFEAKLDLVRNELLHPIAENKTAIIESKAVREGFLSRQFSTDHHYLRDIRVHRHSIMHRGAMMNIAKYKLRTSSCPNIYRNSMWSVEEIEEEKSWRDRVLAVINRSFDVRMFTEFHFLMMNLATLVLFIWFIVPYFYISPFMEEAGYTETEGTLMLSIFGVATIIGIVGLGWAGDQPWVHVTKTYAGCLIICGASIFMFPVIVRTTDPKASCSFYLLALNAVIFGLMFSSSYSYTPSILVELIALERFTMAYGLVLLCQGLGHLIGPPIAGGLKDLTGEWDAAFYVAGVWVVISGLLVGIIPYSKNFRICGTTPLTKDLYSDPEPGTRIIVTH